MNPKKLAKTFAVSTSGLAFSSALDHFFPRKTASNPTVTRLVAVVVAFAAWEFIEPALQRKLGMTAKS